MDWSFREKSVVVSLLVLLGTCGCYFYFVLLGSGPESQAEMLSWMIGLLVVLVVLIVVEVVFHIFIAAFAPGEAEMAADEREKLISLKAHRFGYLVLAEIANNGVQLYHFRRGVG